MKATLKDFEVEQFLDLFLAALVMRNKTTIWVKRERAHEERQRMHALYTFVCARFDALPKDKNTDQVYAMVKLRNHLGPGLIGSFDELLDSIRRKMTTIIDLNFPYCESYSIELHRVTAKCWLEQADPELRKLAEDAADAYMAPLRERATQTPA